MFQPTEYYTIIKLDVLCEGEIKCYGSPITMRFRIALVVYNFKYLSTSIPINNSTTIYVFFIFLTHNHIKLHCQHGSLTYAYRSTLKMYDLFFMEIVGAI